MWVEQLADDYRRRKHELEWLDAHAWCDVARGLDEFRRGLSRFGIRQAVVGSTQARDEDPRAGNRQLIEAVARNDGVWAAVVLCADPLAQVDCRREVQTWIEGKVRLVRLFPRRHNYRLSDAFVGRWLDVLEECRMPVAVWHTEAEWDDVAGVCRRCPGLPVIVEAPNRKLLYHNRVYHRLLGTHPNFHLEIHNLVGYLGVDHVVRRFGAARLLFGSYFPVQDPNASMMLVTHGDFSDDDRRAIAGGNMRRLMGAIRRDPR